MNKSKELFAGYIPVLHDGYIAAFNRHPDATIGIFNDEILSDTPYLRKDIRALSPEDAKQAIMGLGREVLILGKSALRDALKNPIIMPNDDITRNIITNNPDARITTEPVFLRWDRDNSSETSAITPDRIVQMDSDDPIIKTISQELSQSTNWWRHIGVAVIDDENNIVLSSHNSSLPTEYTTCLDCDPRITARKGESIERSIDIHAEAKAIAEASKKGIALEGTTICVSTFPCPNCAKLIALSGIKSCYYIDGYAMLDGYSILKDFDVEVVKLETKLDPEDPLIFKPYPASRS